MSTPSQDTLVLETGQWRPLPSPTWLSQPFWDAAGEGRLIVQRCDECGLHVFRPQYACTRCFSTQLRWTPASGRGVIHSFSIVHRPAYPELPPVYAVVAVEMAEGWYMMSNLIDGTVADVKIGLPIEVTFRSYDGLALPFVKPA